MQALLRMSYETQERVYGGTVLPPYRITIGTSEASETVVLVIETDRSPAPADTPRELRLQMPPDIAKSVANAMLNMDPHIKSFTLITVD